MKSIFLAVAILISVQLPAQQMQTLLGSSKARVSGAYGAAVHKFSSIDNQSAVMLGGYGGVVFSSRLLIGAGAFTLLNGRSIEIENVPDTYRQLTTIGAFAEFTLRPERAIHVTGQLMVGGALRSEQVRLPGDGQATLKSGGSFFVEPGILAEVNVTSWFRAGAGASFRFVPGASVYTGAATQFTLKFGKF